MPPLEVQGEHRDSFLNEAEMDNMREGGKNVVLLNLWQKPRCSSSVETGLSGKFLGCIKAKRTLFEFKREWISFQPQRERASSRGEGIISWFFLSSPETLGFLLSYYLDVRDPLVMPQENQVSMHVARGLLGFPPVGAVS